MSEIAYAPDAGDLIWTDFDPRTGREQSGRWPVPVLSAREFFQASAFVIVCPITDTIRRFGSSVSLPDGLPLSGEILTSHVRGIDGLARPVRYAGAAVPEATLAEVRAKLAVLCGMS
jgi:mRNA interferase MazF